MVAAVSQQAITRTNADQDLWRHMGSPVHNIISSYKNSSTHLPLSLNIKVGKFEFNYGCQPFQYGIIAIESSSMKSYSYSIIGTDNSLLQNVGQTWMTICIIVTRSSSWCHRLYLPCRTWSSASNNDFNIYVYNHYNSNNYHYTINNDAVIKQ